MATRKSTQATKSATQAATEQVLADAAAQGAAPQDAGPQAADFSYLAFIRAMSADAGIEIPSGKQLLAGFVTSLVVGIVGGYAGGVLASYTFVGAVLLTGSTFLAFTSMVLTMLISWYLATIAASRAGMYVATGRLERDAQRVRQAVTSYFKRPHLPTFTTQGA